MKTFSVVAIINLITSSNPGDSTRASWFIFSPLRVALTTITNAFVTLERESSFTEAFDISKYFFNVKVRMSTICRQETLGPSDNNCTVVRSSLIPTTPTRRRPKITDSLKAMIFRSASSTSPPPPIIFSQTFSRTAPISSCLSRMIV